MRAAIVILSIVLALLLAVGGILFFGSEKTPVPEQPSTTTEPATAPPTATTEAPTTTATEPEPEPELIPQEPPVVLQGKPVESFLIDGSLFIRAADFAEAVGMTIESEEPLKLRGADTVELSEKRLTVNGEPYVQPMEEIVYRGEAYFPLLEMAEALRYPMWTDEESGITYITPSARAFEIPENVNVPVLMYHAVSDDMWGINELFVSPSSMDEQLAYLVENGYDASWCEDLAHGADYDKPVILTFDDGYDDNYTELLPLLQKYNVKATVFVIGNAVGMSHKMTEEQIREMAASGLVSIQSHGYTHDDMDVMGEETLEFELSETKKVITRMTGRIPYVLCYPTGKYSNLTLEVGARHYLFGIKMVGGQYNTSDDPFLVSRFYVSRYTDIGTFASYLSAAGT